MFNLSAFLWKCSCYYDYQFYKKNVNRLEKIQLSNLKTILRNAENTDFGNSYSVNHNWTIQDFQNNIPISNYNDYQDYINRITNGKQNVLTKSKIRRLGLTSGSSGRMKYVPFTDLLASEFTKSISVWIYGLLNSYPKLSKGRFYFSVSPAGFPENLNENVKIGFDNDGDYLKPWERIFANQLLVVPEWLSKIQNPEFVMYITALRIIAAKDLTLISVWNPSFLHSLLENIVKNKDSLIKDLQYGTISNFDQIIPSNILNSLKIHDPYRSKELSKLLRNEIKWENVWKDLTCISLWSDSFAKYSFEKLKEIFPNVNFESKGVIATEGIFSIPFYENEKEPKLLLAYTSHFYEFMDEFEKIYLSSQLSIGKEYEIIITTGGGLYRYRIGDRFLITGYYNQIPILKFIGRNDDISDLVGEKISELFLRNELLPELKKYYLTPNNSFLRGNLLEERAFYELVIAPSDLGNRKLELVTLVDTILCRNPHYEYARKIGQLGEVKLSQMSFESTNQGRSSTTKDRFLRRPIDMTPKP
ncbi:GH3 auxin-responsive promoter family protein (plasmid) [Leptospira sp. WS39.C2]